MSAKISYDTSTPAVSIELIIKRPLPDYDLDEVEAPVPRDVDPMLASQGFKDLLDEARSILDRELSGSGLEIGQLTGAICRDGTVHRPGIWLVLRERTAARDAKDAKDAKEMSPAARHRVVSIAETLRTALQLS